MGKLSEIGTANIAEVAARDAVAAAEIAERNLKVGHGQVLALKATLVTAEATTAAARQAYADNPEAET